MSWSWQLIPNEPTVTQSTLKVSFDKDRQIGEIKGGRQTLGGQLLPRPVDGNMANKQKYQKFGGSIMD